jgi:hypothetical protein
MGKLKFRTKVAAKTQHKKSAIVVTILKMATGRNASMSGINSGHHHIPIYEISLKSNNVEFVEYCGIQFENGDRYSIKNRQ